MSTQPQIKDIIKSEYKKCAKDPVYFFKKYCYIQHPVKGRIKFDLYKFQEKVLQKLSENDYSIILKSRQLGITTLSAAISLHLMIFSSDKNIIVIATKQDIAKNMITKVRYMYDNLPSWLREPYVENNKLNLRLSNGSQIKATTSAVDSARSEAVSMLVVDECAFIDEMEEIWGASQQTLAEGGKAIVLSTPNGVSNWFHKEWIRAKEGSGKFHPIQLHWSMHPDRDQAWRDLQDELLGPRLAAQECFDENTRVYTSRGLKKISEIIIGDYVLTHTGKFKRVLKVFSRISSNLFEISSFNNKNKRFVTKNHPFLNLKTEWVELSNITTESVLRNIPNDIKIDWTNIGTFDLYEKFVPKYFNKKLKSDDVFYINDRKHKTLCNRYIDIDYDIGYLIGLYLAEGSRSRLRCVFTFNSETEYNTWPIKLQKIIENKFGLKNYTIRQKNGNSADLEISSEILSSFLGFFIDGNRCYDKKLSDMVFDFKNKEFFRGILDGVFRGDGCLTNTNNKKISITSLNAIYDIKYISTLLGYDLSSIRIVDAEYKENYKNYVWYDKKYSYHNTYILSFYDTKDVVVNNEFTVDINPIKLNYNYKNCVFRDNYYVNSKIYIDECDAEMSVYNIEVEDDNSYVTEHFIVHNCDADFLASGNTVVDPDTLKFYKETFIKPPSEYRGSNKELWVWEQPIYTKTYVVSADVSRGDGTDYSTAEVFDIESVSQVAEFKAKIDTKEFGNFLVGLATEYNDALLVIDNSTVGWAVIQQVLDRRYQNLFYTTENLKYIDMTKDHFKKLYSKEKKAVAGFVTGPTVRPLMIENMERYFRTRNIGFYSERGLNELYAFIYKNNKAEAMTGYNDDIVMAIAMLLWVRDTALRLSKERIKLSMQNLENFTVNRPDEFNNVPHLNPAHLQWHMPTGNPNEEENLSEWMI